VPPSDRLYLPNLNGIRFVAAAMVFVNHVEWIKSTGGVPSYSHLALMCNNGALGVDLFFVLSGFLITYLLVAEKRQRGEVSIRAFYVRRILRIWPLYYLTVALAFFILPGLVAVPSWNFSIGGPDYLPRLGLFLMMLPNVANVLYPLVPFASQLWSVGVEEQFYLAWPFVCRAPLRRIPAILVGIVVAIVLCRTGVHYLAARTPGSDWVLAESFFRGFRVQCMAIGGLAAWLLHHGDVRLLGALFSRLAQAGALALAGAIHVLSYDAAGSLQTELTAALFALLILNAAGNPRTMVRLEAGPLPYLGRISYGIYVYQFLTIRVSFLILERWADYANPLHRWLTLYALSAALTLAVAALSYRFIEQPFLRLKERFSAVPTAA
jgi:peptidoglycan/LPS O-acetylase OafA/YrhL